MTPDNAAEHRLNASTALLVLSDSTTLDYLQNILQFIDCDVHVPDSVEEFQRLAQRFSDRSVSVFVSSQLPDETRTQFLSAINAMSPRPAPATGCSTPTAGARPASAGAARWCVTAA